MSLAIDVDQIKEVLIAGVWYPVKKKSFSMDSYEFLWYHNKTDRSDYRVLHAGGNDNISACGFSFYDGKNTIEDRLVQLQRLRGNYESK